MEASASTSVARLLGGIDGTTTATILAQAILHQGPKNVTAGAKPMFLRRGVEKAVKNLEFVEGMRSGKQRRR